MLQEKSQALSISLIGVFFLLPFANFIFRSVDMWQAQGYFLQLGILLIFSIYLFLKNKPLGALLLWSGLTTFYHCYQYNLLYSKYYTVGILPFFNLICFIILYEVLTKVGVKEYRNIFKGISFALIAVLFYCILQKLNLDQFYKNYDPQITSDSVVGTVGNPMHLAQYVAITMPVFFLYDGWVRKSLILLALSVIGLTGSSSGLLAAVSVIIFYSFFHRIFNVWEIILFSVISFFAISYRYHFDYYTMFSAYLSTGTRFEFWGKFFPFFKDKAITGYGLGAVNILAKNIHGITSGSIMMRHLHNAFYHFAIELGVIGVVICFWIVVDYFRKFRSIVKTQLEITGASMFVGFLICSLFGFPTHLWLLSSAGLLGYCCIYKGV